MIRFSYEIPTRNLLQPSGKYIHISGFNITMNTIKTQTTKLKAKRTFFKKGTCSRTFFYILDREFGHPMDEEEKASDMLAGGIMQQGYQCGMLWGATMATGAESFRRFKDHNTAIGIALRVSRQILDSFKEKAGSIECADITGCDMTKGKGLAKFFFRGKFVTCYKLAGKWAAEAVKVAEEGLSSDQSDFPEKPMSCASELVRKMGGTDHEITMVAGFDGGLGLSGNGCGALAAAVWMNALKFNRKQSDKSSAKNPDSDKILEAFNAETDYEFECHKICGRKFNSVEEHTVFIKTGGCEKLIDVLAQF